MSKKIMTEEEKQEKEAKKAEKKLLKEQREVERFNLLDAIEYRFDLVPDVKLSKKEKTVLKAIECAKEMNFYELCDYMDAKPSKIDDILVTLFAYGLVGYKNDDETNDIYVITNDGSKYLSAKKAVKKSEKRFREFLDCLSNEELKEFLDLCGNLVEADAQEAVPAEEENKEA